MKLIKSTFILLVITSATISFAKAQEKKISNDFYQNSRKVFNQMPYGSMFIVDAKSDEYMGLHSNQHKILAQPNDRVEDLFQISEAVIINAYDIDEREIISGKVKYVPWTGYYWSMQKGLIANRYNDRKFKRKWTFKGRLKLTKKRPSSYFIKKKQIHKLSPSEKYELLIGDVNHNLSNHMWQRGLDEIEKYGRVRNWAGLCHGLALAPIALPTPKHSIKLKSFDGKHLIKFFPEDIKALGIWLWSGDDVPSRIVGGRCERTNPRTDSIGRSIDADCQDTNPATFHLAILNKVGIKKVPLIMDNAPEQSVWNFPIINYKFTYFNPSTMKNMDKITNAMIPIKDFSQDKFKEFRAEGTEYIVGVRASIHSLTFGNPRARETEGTSNSSTRNHIYRYDLELNANGDIIGGEWYSRNHPDFLWVPHESANPMGSFDNFMEGTWDATTDLLPASWAEQAVKSAAEGEVSAPIVKALFELSSKGVSQ